MNYVWALAFVGVVAFFVWRKRRSGDAAAVVLVTDPVNHLDAGITRAVRIPTVRGAPRESKAMRKARQAAICGFLGYNGSGKSANMIRCTLPDLAAGLPVLSTMALVASKPAETIEEADAAWEALGIGVRPVDLLLLPHHAWIPFTDFRQLVSFRDGIVLMDEVQGVADSRESLGLPVQVANMLFQLRRNGVVLRWSTIDYTAADRRIRTATQLVVQHRGLMPKWDASSIWPRNRLFYIRVFDGRGFNDFTTAMNRTTVKQRPKSLAREFVLGSRGFAASFKAYDSDCAVLALGADGAMSGGMCLGCGGARSRVKCSCADHGQDAGGETSGDRTRQRAERTQAKRGSADSGRGRHPGGSEAQTDEIGGRHSTRS